MAMEQDDSFYSSISTSTRSSLLVNDEENDDNSSSPPPTPISRPPPAIVCFQHCIKGRNFFCSLVPATCPSCQQPMLTDSFTLPPFCLFAPWASSHTVPCSIVLRPTFGSFFRNYNGFEDLHVGISDSNGSVTHYDKDGIQTDPFWPECLSAEIDHSIHDPTDCRENSTKIPEAAARRTVQCRWDNLISVFKISWRQMMMGKSYDEVTDNCFDFVWTFVKEYHGLCSDRKRFESLCQTKDCFTEHRLLPVIQKTLKFNHLALGVEQRGSIIVDDRG